VIPLFLIAPAVAYESLRLEKEGPAGAQLAAVFE
jgi:hypothetical protein